MNFFITVFGWFAWNAILFRIEKDKYDEKDEAFPLRKYASKYWDNWLASASLIPILLWLGYQGLGIPGAFSPLDATKLEWSELYYLGAGFFVEVIIFAYSKWTSTRK